MSFEALRSAFIDYIKILNQNGGTKNLQTEEARDAFDALHHFYTTQKSPPDVQAMNRIEKYHSHLEYACKERTDYVTALMQYRISLALQNGYLL